ncbi:helix-turn-helix transcriptional regulator [Clostridium paraputrificum]|uniref:helix-turn-helix transcriptional regulator n=1 Tax=Clostridium paraputrificum TaxID=29363 RepID=UPI000666C79F|nr:helix-turn-helix transcriptional regulator [Clostridium paraputrificum]
MVSDKNIIEQQVKRLQANLLAIRKIAGWTAQDLGDRIGVTKQTISNLENGKSKLTQTQYIAIRAVLDYEIQNNKENTVLPQVIAILLNDENEDEFDEEKEKQITSAVNTVAATAAGGIAGAQLAAVAGAVLLPLAGPVGMVGGAILGAGLGWLNPFMKNKKSKEIY